MPALTCSHRSRVDFRRQSVPASKSRKRRGQLMSAWVRNGVLMGADELVAELGGDLTALRREVGLEPLDDPDFPIPALAVVEFLERAASVCACEAFGLLLSQKQDFSIFGPLWPFFRRASTVGEVLHDLAEFSTRCTGGGREDTGRGGFEVRSRRGCQDGPMATTVTEGEPRESRTSSATSMRWQGKLATFAECQLNGFANCRAVESVASDNGVAIVQLHSVRVEDGLDDVVDPSSSVAVGWRPLLQFGAYPLLSRPEPLSGQNLSGDPEQEHFLRRSGRGHHHHPVEVCRASSYRAQFLLRP